MSEVERSKNHLKYQPVPEWVVERVRQAVSKVGGKIDFREKFKISESYLSLLINGKRHPPESMHPMLGIKLVATPLEYRDLEDE